MLIWNIAFPLKQVMKFTDYIEVESSYIWPPNKRPMFDFMPIILFWIFFWKNTNLKDLFFILCIISKRKIVGIISPWFTIYFKIRNALLTRRLLEAKEIFACGYQINEMTRYISVWTHWLRQKTDNETVVILDFVISSLLISNHLFAWRFSMIFFRSFLSFAALISCI